MQLFKIVNDIDDKAFIGMSSQMLWSPMSMARCKARDGNKDKLSLHMRTIGIEHFTIELISEHPYSNKEQAKEIKEAAVCAIPIDLCLNKCRISRKKGETNVTYKDRYFADMKKDKERLEHYKARKQHEYCMYKEK